MVSPGLHKLEQRLVCAEGLATAKSSVTTGHDCPSPSVVSFQAGESGLFPLSITDKIRGKVVSTQLTQACGHIMITHILVTRDREQHGRV